MWKATIIYGKDKNKMKITGFNSQIVTKDPESVMALFEALGFKRTHKKTGTERVCTSFCNVRNAPAIAGAFLTG